MSFCRFQFSSKVLGQHKECCVILPDVGKPPFPTYYLLHGLSDDHTIWHRRTRIETYVANLPLIVVMPDGGRGFYTNMDAGPRWADHFAQELPALIERNFPARPARAARCVGGLSMGGYGALRLALGFPEVYCSANSHSGALAVPARIENHRSIENAELVRTFGRRPVGSEHDLDELARRARKSGRLPRIRIDCGTGDFLLAENRHFHAVLDKLGIPHEYEEFEGGHTWDYWDLHVREALAFHAQSLKIRAIA